ncbi:MAG: molecular chaperone DnaJ [Candidatus Tectomicrobia bacterium]|nr:molecular chaperone DnaJ [Candidatus Tectomicrobia bacterium]
MTKRDYYEILQVDRQADETKIKKAYRKLALQYHPDKNPGNKRAEEKFKEITEAYEVLGNAQKRAQYDRFGAVGAGISGNRGNGRDSAGPSFSDLFEDLFADFFGGGSARTRPRPKRGDDLRYRLEISLEESALGTEKTIKVPRSEICFSCSGTGIASGREAQVCPICGGRGQIRLRQGFFTTIRTCGHCRGEGRVINDPCESCGGKGAIHREKTLSIKVPPGVSSGTRLKLAGEGEVGFKGGPPGDLYVIIEIKPHPIFTKEGNDLLCEIPITFPQATLGAELDVPTLEGHVKMKIPQGTQSGMVFKLKGKGFPEFHGHSRGDQLVKVVIKVPTKLNAKQRKALEEFAQLTDEITISPKKGFFEKVKELFQG